MKKPLALALLIVGNTLVTFVAGFGAMFLVMTLFWFGIVLSMLILAGHIYGAVMLEKNYSRNWNFSGMRFWLCAAVPAAAISGVGFGIVTYLDSIGYFSGFFAGLGEYLSTVSCLIYSGLYLLVLGIVLCFVHRQNKPLFVLGGLLAAVTGACGLLSGVYYAAIWGLIHAVVFVAAQIYTKRKLSIPAFEFWALIAAPAAIITGILFLIQTIIGGGYSVVAIAFYYSFPAAVVLGVILMLKSLIRRRMHKDINNKE